MSAYTQKNKPISWQERTGRQMLAMSGAEVAGAVAGAVALGALYTVDSQTPTPIKKLHDNLAHYVVKPIMPAIQWMDKTFSNLWKDGYKQRAAMSNTDRARVYEDVLAKYGLAFGAGTAAKFWTRNVLNKALHVPTSMKHGLKVIGIDEGMHMALTMCCLHEDVAKNMHHAQKHLSSILKKAGVPDEQADNVTSYCVNLEGPNLAALGIADVYIALSNWNAARRGMHL